MAVLDSRAVLIGIMKIPASNNSSLDHTPAANTAEVKFVSSAQFAGFDSISISTPEDAFTGTITVRELADHTSDETVEANWVTVQSPPGTDVAIAALKSIVLTALPFPALAIFSSGSEADEATFFVYGHRGAK